MLASPTLLWDSLPSRVLGLISMRDSGVWSMNTSIKDYCTEFAAHVDETKRARHNEAVVLDIASNCGQDVKALVDKAREVPIDPFSARTFWDAIFDAACVLYFG